MPQKKKTNKKTNKKTHKKHLTQKQNIIFQSIPNYASGQTTGHQYNKDHVQFVPQQAQQSHTDNIVGELVGRLMNKIENNENKEVQQYTKEVQPINNNNNVNVYNNIGTTESKKPDETPSSDSKPDSKIPDSISNGVKSAARSVGEDFAIQAGAGLASIVTAALGTAGIRNRKAIRNSISNFPSNARNSLGTIRERFRGSSAYRPQVDVPNASVAGSPPASVAGSRRPSNAASQGPMEILSESIGMSPARAARPPRAASASPRDSEVFIRESDSVARRNRPRSDSISSNYNTGNVSEQFTITRPRRPALNTEQRGLLERTLRNQNIDPSNISPIRPDVLRGGFSSSPRRTAVTISNTPQTNRLSDTLRSGRPSGIQQHDGVNTRSIRAETGEPHTQYQTPVRGRRRTRPFGPQPQPNRRGRPTNAELAARAEAQVQPVLQTPARGVTRNMSNWKSTEKKSN
jgi:hypothetical protein